MSDISNIYSKTGASYDTLNSSKVKSVDKVEAIDSGKKSQISGKTIGNPKLSDKAQKYYEELKKKYHNMEFVLVSEDEKENAKANAASFANKNKMVVLVNEEKIERMAEDSAYRSQIEGLIEKTSQGFAQFSNSVAATGANVKGYGMQVNDDGTTSFFAVLEKSTKAQTERIAKKRAEKQAAKKAEAKKAAKEKAKEKIEENREAGKSDKAENAKESDKSEDIVITANSFEELIRKIEDHVQLTKSDTVFTEAEKKVGQNVDFSA